MRTIAHISDLHFGTEEPRVVEALLAQLAEAKPHLIVVSGDLTQRAREKQFAAARAFLDRLPAPWLAVPGNHDVPLYDVFRRFLAPLERYKRHITDDLAPTWIDDEIAVIGINTARSLTIKDGRISMAQVDRLREQLAAIPEPRVRVVVTHHQLVQPPRSKGEAHHEDVVGRAKEALEAMDEAGVDLMLAGHLHSASSQDVRAEHPGRRSMLVVQCGTSVSTRVRDEPNSYNLIHIQPHQITVSVRGWKDGAFVERHVDTYVLQRTEWRRVA
jgi:3',5'-cyclic AMP phosphodiesterase CpdA